VIVGLGGSAADISIANTQISPDAVTVENKSITIILYYDIMTVLFIV